MSEELIRIACPECGGEIEVQRDWDKRKCLCPYCEKKFIIDVYSSSIIVAAMENWQRDEATKKVGTVSTIKAKLPYQEFLQCEEWLRIANMPTSLPIPLGKDVSGQNVVEDLSRMDSLVIVGSDMYDQGCALDQILSGWLSYQDPKSVEIVLVDAYEGNNLVMRAFRRFPHVIKYVSGSSGREQMPTTQFDRQVDAVIRTLRSEVQMRRNIMRISGMASFCDFAEKHPTPRRIYVFFDSPADNNYLRMRLREVFARDMRDAGIHIILSSIAPVKCTDVYQPYLKNSVAGIKVGCVSFLCANVRMSNNQFGGPEAVSWGHVFYRSPENDVSALIGLESPEHAMSSALEAKWLSGNKAQTEILKNVDVSLDHCGAVQGPSLIQKKERLQIKIVANESLDLLCHNCASATSEGRNVFWAVTMMFGAVAAIAYVYFTWYIWLPILLLALPIASVIGKACFGRYRTDVSTLGTISKCSEVWCQFDVASHRRTLYAVSWCDKFRSEYYADVTHMTHGHILDFVGKMPPCLTSQSHVPVFNLGSGRIALLDKVAVYVGGFYPTMCVLPYADFQIMKTGAKIRRWTNPDDGSNVHVFWDHSRIDGGRDRRYKENGATYLCYYDLIAYFAKAMRSGIVIKGGIVMSER